MPSASSRTTAVSAVVAAALAAGLLTGAATTSASASSPAVSSPSADGQVRIHDIQGTTRISPLAGQQVAGVPGIVTGVRTNGSKGFWFQDPNPDADPATSEGVFVYTGSTPTVAVGDAVTVSGTVAEFVPGGAASGNQSLTQITRPAVAVVSSGNALPAPVTVSERSVPARYTPAGDPAAGGSIDALPSTRPATPWTTTSPWRA